MPIDEFIERAGEELPDDWDRDRFAAIAPHIQQRLTTLREVPGKVDFLFWPDGAAVEYEPDAWDKAFAPEWARPLLADVLQRYAEVPWTADALKASLESAMEPYAIKLGKAQAPVRVAVTGRTVGPPLFESLEVLGRDETLRRLTSAADRLAASGRGPDGG